MTLWRFALRELGYTSSVSREQGMRELREDHAAAAAAASKGRTSSNCHEAAALSIRRASDEDAAWAATASK